MRHCHRLFQITFAHVILSKSFLSGTKVRFQNERKLQRISVDVGKQLIQSVRRRGRLPGMLVNNLATAAVLGSRA